MTSWCLSSAGTNTPFSARSSTPSHSIFYCPTSREGTVSAELVPFRTLYDYFASALREGDGKTIAALRESTSARMVHLLAPPPKKKNHFIEHYHDTLFASEGIQSRGVSSPALRMKFWKLQNVAIGEICADRQIATVPPPPAALDPEGFLARDFYAGDATHANARLW